MKVRLLDAAEARLLLGPAAARAACRDALVALARAAAEQADVLTIRIAEHEGEVHAKGGYLHRSPFFSIKVATGFARNPALGLPSSSGCTWVFDAATGMLRTLVLDQGYLTDLRTGAAGAIAADLLARPDCRVVGMIGAGHQARFQLEALLQVRKPELVLVWNRHQARAEHYAEEMEARFRVPTRAVATARDAVAPADIVVTVTAATAPIVWNDWVAPGTHLTAVGSDMSSKRELDPALLARATVVADRLSQCRTQGEIHHAVRGGFLKPGWVGAELGEILAGLKPGRTDPSEITIADLTGVGVLDAAVANAVASAAEAADVGRWIEVA